MDAKQTEISLPCIGTGRAVTELEWRKQHEKTWIWPDGSADRDRPIVARIDEEYSEELQALSGDMEIEVRLAAE